MAEARLTQQKKDVAGLQGDAYRQALDIMKNDVDVLKTQEADDFTVNLACEEAEGMYYPDGPGKLEWQVPAPGQNKHLEIAVQDKLDGRFVPGLQVRAKVTASDGTVLYDDILPFLWHPFLWHYGSNIHIDGPGTYNFAITIEQPQFGRHDEKNGKRYPRTVTLEFKDIHLKPGREPHGAE